MRYVERCQNLNHRRSDAPVRFCSGCGDVVNAAIRPKNCSIAQHDASRRGHATYCIDCGQQLMTPQGR